MGNHFAYERISTELERGKQHFNRQDKALMKYATEHDFEYLHVFRDDASGKNFDRPEWKKLEAALHPDDTIVFKDISRFTREAINGYKKYMILLERDINLVFLDNPTVSTDYIRMMTQVAKNQDLVSRVSMEGTIKLLLIVELDRVEKERLTLIQRTKDGIAASNKRQGRKKGTLDKMTPELAKDLQKYNADRKIKVADLMKKYRISRNTLKKYAAIVAINGS